MAFVLLGGTGCTMKRTKALGVALAAALSGSLLIGCTSNNEGTTTSSTPPASTPATVAPASLVGDWKAQGDTSYACLSGHSWPTTFLSIPVDGKWVLPFCDNGGTYEVTIETITWLGGDTCATGVKGVYTYTLNNDQLTQEVTDDPCGPRKDAFDGVTLNRMPENGETYSPSPSAS